MKWINRINNGKRLKLLFVFAIIIIVFNVSNAQKIDIVKSDFDYNYSSTTVHKIFGHDRDYFYVIKFTKNQYYIEKLDNNLNLVKTEPIKLHEGFRTFDLETIVHFHNEIYMLSSHRRFNNISLYYTKINKETLLADTTRVEIAKIGFIKGNWADFHFALSRKETKLAVICRTKLSLSKVQFNEYYVFGKDMELLWTKKDMIDFKGQGPRDNKYIVDEKGNISILSLLKRASIISVFRDVKNVYTIYRYTHNGEFFQEYPITLINRYIRGLKIIGTDSGDLVCAGLYSEIFRAGVRGTFFFRIDPDNGRIYDNTAQEFNEEMIGRLIAGKEPVIADEELIKYVMTDLVLRDNGKIILIAEQLFEQTYDTYNNLIVTCFDTTGQVYWTNVIPKNQDFNINLLKNEEIEPEEYRDYVIETGSIKMEIENYCSYALMAPVDKNSIVLFFNDHIKNLAENNKKTKNFNQPRRSYIQAVIIDEYGNINKKAVAKWKKKALYPVPMRYYDTLHDTIVIPAFKGRKYNYYKLTTELYKE